jgi:hypothetical protein
LAKSKSTATVRVEYALARLVTGALRFLPERIAYFAARV